eukprot:TRINITY_DN2268_c0_g1_i3.p1 TRINITY_DN2268_c0_g1~~TRINITY_DN2268_c0_g1_i3.p1  ORF type:complete len:437 (+),score=78.46 TRINITY_DN2268_c0_g1_i3:911-2221(+)
MEHTTTTSTPISSSPSGPAISARRTSPWSPRGEPTITTLPIFVPQENGEWKKIRLTEINIFVEYYFSIHHIVTLYDLEKSICLLKNVRDYNALHLGSIFEVPLIKENFRHLTSIPQITESMVSAKLYSWLSIRKGLVIEEDFLQQFRDFDNKQSVGHHSIYIPDFEYLWKRFNHIEQKKHSNTQDLDIMAVFDEDMSCAQNIQTLDLLTVQNNTLRFISFLANFMKDFDKGMEELKNIIHRHTLTKITYVPETSPCYAFAALKFFEDYKNDIEMHKTELNSIPFTSTLLKVKHYCLGYKDVEILQLSFGIPPLSIDSFKCDSEQLSYLISKMICWYRSFEHPLVNKVVDGLKAGFDFKTVLETLGLVWIEQQKQKQAVTNEKPNKGSEKKRKGETMEEALEIDMDEENTENNEEENFEGTTTTTELTYYSRLPPSQ